MFLKRMLEAAGELLKEKYQFCQHQLLAFSASNSYWLKEEIQYTLSHTETDTCRDVWVFVSRTNVIPQPTKLATSANGGGLL